MLDGLWFVKVPPNYEQVARTNERDYALDNGSDVPKVVKVACIVTDALNDICVMYCLFFAVKLLWHP